jgi:catalase
MENNKKKLATASGKPFVENGNTMSVREKSPLLLLQDVALHENVARFNREPIHERTVLTKDAGAFGTFTVTNDVSQHTKAKLFNKIGKQTKVFVRFSEVDEEKVSTDTERGAQRFAIKFYTEDGNWDLVGNNTPVFFIKDPKKFPDFLQIQKRDPHTNCKNSTMMWDFWSMNPESLHQVMILMSDRGRPKGHRYMNGYGSHTYSMINENNKKVWVKFHFKTMQGIKNFTNKNTIEMEGKDPDFAQRDLIDAISKKDFPKWALKIQVMDDEEAKKFLFNPFDVTKIWPQKKFPLIDIGVLELNEIPENYFKDIEQNTFAPAHIVDGINYSPDKILQERLRSGNASNYYLNDLENIFIDKPYKEPHMVLENDTSDWYDQNAERSNDHFTQPRWLFNKVMNDYDRKNLISNIVVSMNEIKGGKKELIIKKQLCHFFYTDMQLGMAIAKKLGADIDTCIKDFKHALMHA